MAKWQCCPVCNGRGIVPHGFYKYSSGQEFVSTGTSPEQCRTCIGVGIIQESMFTDNTYYDPNFGFGENLDDIF